MVKNKEVIFASIPKGAVKTSDLQVKESEIELSVKEGSGDVIVKTMYISLDPYYRARMMEVKAGLYMEPFQLGKVCLPPFLYVQSLEQIILRPLISKDLSW